jgi:hypothetical protein
MSSLSRIFVLGRKLTSDPEFAAKIGSVMKSTARVAWAEPKELRHLAPWLTSLLPHHSTVADEVPWINFDAIAWLESWLRPNMQVFEYGSGGSSLFFARRTQHVVSIEHDSGFYDFISGVISERKIGNLDLRKILPTKTDKKEKYDGYSFRSFSAGHETNSFKDYVCSIDEFDDGYFNLVIVDGRARASCVMRAINKVKPGGAILLDNSERVQYCEVQEHLRGVGFLETKFRSLGPSNTYVWETSVFRKVNQ